MNLVCVCGGADKMRVVINDGVDVEVAVKTRVDWSACVGGEVEMVFEDGEASGAVCGEDTAGCQRVDCF